MAWNDPPSFDYQQVSNSAKFKHRYVKVGQSQQFQSQQIQPQQFQPQQQQPMPTMPTMQESYINNTAIYENQPRDNFAPYNGQHLNQDSQLRSLPMNQPPCTTATSALPSNGATNFAGQVDGQGTSTDLFQGSR